MYRSNAGKIRNCRGTRAKEEKCERAETCEKGGRGRGWVSATGRETNDPVSRCAEVIKSRQIFSLSRRVSDTYIILKGLLRGHYTPGETSPKLSLSRARKRTSERARAGISAFRSAESGAYVSACVDQAGSFLRYVHGYQLLRLSRSPFVIPYPSLRLSVLAVSRDRAELSLYERSRGFTAQRSAFLFFFC